MSNLHNEEEETEKEKEKEKDNTCNELKNIQYQTMLLNQHTDTPMSNTSENLTDLNDFFDKEKESNKQLPWSKLDKSLKLRKISNYVRKYAQDHDLDKSISQELGYYLKDCLERRKLQRQKDIEYDKITGCIKHIPNLVYNKHNGTFILKTIEKKQGITKGLAPKSKKKTLKYKAKDKDKDKHTN